MKDTKDTRNASAFWNVVDTAATRRGMSMKVLAKKCDMIYSSMHTLYAKDRYPRLDKGIKICEVLNLDPINALDGTEKISDQIPDERKDLIHYLLECDIHTFMQILGSLRGIGYYS